MLTVVKVGGGLGRGPADHAGGRLGHGPGADAGGGLGRGPADHAGGRLGHGPGAGAGGGIGDDALRALCVTLGALGERHPLLVVPGGGDFADAVRDADRRFGLSAATAHRMAILGMEQFGWLLADLIPGAVPCADLQQVARGRTTVLLPASLPLDALPESWDVTSDSIAAWVAERAGAGRLVLVKGVDGLFADWPPRGEPLPSVTVAELAALRPGGVDEYLPTVLERASFETWVVGGRDPERVVELLERGATVGTRIAPARLVR